MMVERLKHEGTSHSSSDLLKICVKMGASWSAHDFRQAGVTPSGSGAFLILFLSCSFFLKTWGLMYKTLRRFHPKSVRMCHTALGCAGEERALGCPLESTCEEQALKSTCEEQALEGTCEDQALEGLPYFQMAGLPYSLAGLPYSLAAGLGEPRAADLRWPLTAAVLRWPWVAAGSGEPRTADWFRLGPGHFPDTGRSLLSNTILWCLGGSCGGGNRPEPEQVEDSRVMQLCHRGEPAEFLGVLHEGEIVPDSGEEVGGELHWLGGGKNRKKLKLLKNGKQNEGGEALLTSV